MKFSPPLQKGRLLRRYKRFLADVELADGQVITVHCPNTGSMKNCLVANSPCWFSESANPKRKYPHTWEIATAPGRARAGINTGRANGLVLEAIAAGNIPELSGYQRRQTEVKYGSENSRIDILLRDDSRPPCFVEVKNVTLAEAGGQGFFPDAVSERGRKHLRELMAEAQRGNRAVLFFCVQHSGIKSVSPADHIDPAYGATLREALAAGVEVLAYKARLTAREIVLQESLSFRLP